MVLFLTLAIHLDRDVREAFKVNAQSPSSCLGNSSQGNLVIYSIYR
ncbi:putative peptidase M18, domain 2 [Rosa chinensis]|uniref:Putative peptidase M18, domain 2 n=1 Tax=Rosa chinensis TaxID=74649 RepID=A0A2P6SCS6_ROSCH|nr:putative peptidase M18, domain 2 [Rosa chinensis]